MITLVSDFLSRTHEYQQWGATTVTASFFLSLLVTAITAWGLLKQNQTLWNKRNADAVSISWLSYHGVLQLVILAYGIATFSLALIVNGLLAALYLPILIGLHRFKGFSPANSVAVALFLLALLVMVLTPYKAWFFFAFAAGGLISIAAQPHEMWRKKSAQGLDRRLVATLLFGTVVWFVYGIAIFDWVLIAINAAAFTLFSLTLILAHRYRAPMTTEPSTASHT